MDDSLIAACVSLQGRLSSGIKYDRQKRVDGNVMSSIRTNLGVASPHTFEVAKSFQALRGRSKTESEVETGV